MTPTALYCNDQRVGELRNAFFSDATWFGTVVVTLDEDSPLAQRIRSFIAFCIDWHNRVDSEPDADEFNDFADVVYECRWAAVADDGTQHPMDAAPAFFADGEVTWRPG